MTSSLTTKILVATPLATPVARAVCEDVMVSVVKKKKNPGMRLAGTLILGMF